EQLLDFPRSRLLRSQQLDLDELLRDSAAALHGLAGGCVHRERSDDSREVDGAVLVKVAVLGSQGGRRPGAAHVRELQEQLIAAVGLVLTDHAAGAVVDDDRPGRRDLLAWAGEGRHQPVAPGADPARDYE